ncbi:MAG: inositol monophosphatase family protein, partial [Actinomycetota bacterium]
GPVDGVDDPPVLDETHVATPAAATLIRNGATTDLVASPVTALDEAIVLCTHPDMFDTPELAAAFGRLEDRVRLVRYSGDCVNYGLLAAGQVHLVVENQLAPYDILPLVPIIEGSGAVVSDRAGGHPFAGGFVVAACTPGLHQAALEVLTADGDA